MMRNITNLSCSLRRMLCLAMVLLFCGVSSWAKWDRDNYFKVNWDPSLGCIHVEVTYFATYGAHFNGYEGFLDFYHGFFIEIDDKQMFNGVINDKGDFNEVEILPGVTYSRRKIYKDNKQKEWRSVADIYIPVDKLGVKRVYLRGHWWRNGAAEDENIDMSKRCDVRVTLSDVVVDKENGVYYDIKRGNQDYREEPIYKVYWKDDKEGAEDDIHSSIQLFNEKGNKISKQSFNGYTDHSGTFVMPVSSSVLNAEEVLLVKRIYERGKLHVERSTRVVRKSYPYPTGVELSLNKDTRKAKISVQLSAAPSVHTLLDPIHIELHGHDKVQGKDFTRIMELNPIVGKQNNYVQETELPEHCDVSYEVKVGRLDSWKWYSWKPYRVSRAGFVAMEHADLESVQAKLNDDNTTATLTWTTNGKYWSRGSILKIVRYANGSEAEDAVFTIHKEDEWMKGQFVDRTMVLFNTYKYTFQVIPGGDYAPRPLMKAAGEMSPSTIGKIPDLKVSKGYFSKYIKLDWNIQGAFDKFVVYRREHQAEGGVGEFRQVGGEIPIRSGMTTYTFNDEECSPGTVYEYYVAGLIDKANVKAISQDTCVGFRTPTGDVSGRVAFKNGQAVKNVEVRLTAESPDKRGCSVRLDGNLGSYLCTTAKLEKAGPEFSAQLFVRPDASYRDSTHWKCCLLQTDVFELNLEDGVPCFFLKKYDDYAKAKTPIPYDQFSQISVTYDRKENYLLLMVNGRDVAKCHLIQDVQTDNDYLTIGKGFKGWIDEVRVWNRALSVEEIKNTYFRMLTGKEDGLIAYYRLNEAVVGNFFDQSYSEERYHEQDGKFFGNVTYDASVTPSESQLAYVGYTDEKGDYLIKGIPYFDEGTPYTLSPILDAHVFSHDNFVGPATIIINDKRDYFVVDFTDVSSFLVSGHVYYSGSTVPVKGASFYVDATLACDAENLPILSDEQGYFAINVPVGNHEVWVQKDGHRFANGGRLLNSEGNLYNFQKDMADVQFLDSTRVRLIGRIAGGPQEDSKDLGCSLSKNILADDINFVLKLKTLQGNIVNERVERSFYNVRNDSNRVAYSPSQVRVGVDNATGEYVVDLFPEQYEVVQMNIEGYDDVLGDKRPTIELRDKLDKKYVHWPLEPAADGVQDSMAYNNTYCLRIDEQPALRVESITIPIEEFGDVHKEDAANEYYGSLFMNISTFGDSCLVNDSVALYDNEQKIYTFGKPVFVENSLYTFRLKAGMPFRYNGDPNRVEWVPVSGGKVSITNTIRTENDSVTLNNEGLGIYQFFPNNPDLSLATGGVKDIQFAMSVGDNHIDPVKIEGYVLGGKLLGANFVTKGPSDLLFVLRDPPGTGSYSYVNQVNMKMNSNIKLEGGQAVGDLGLGWLTQKKLTVSYNECGIVVNKGSAWAFENDNGLTGRLTLAGSDTRGTTLNVSMSQRISTSQSPEFVGRNGDVFVGFASNIQMGERECIGITDAAYVASKGTTVQTSASGKYAIFKGNDLMMNKEFTTAFAYPQVHIEKVIIPQTQQVIDDLLQRGNGLSEAEAMMKAKQNNYAVYVSHADVLGTDNYVRPNEQSEWFAQKRMLKGEYYDVYYPESQCQNEKFLPLDSVLEMDIERNNWKQLLARNEQTKVMAHMEGSRLRNISYQGGATITGSKKMVVNTTDTHINDVQFTFGETGSQAIGGKSMARRLKYGLHGNYHHNDKNTEQESNETEIGYVLSELGGDYMNLDVYEVPQSRFTNEDGEYVSSESLDEAPTGEYVFYLKGGATSNPHEGMQRTKYYEPGKHLLSEGSLQVEVPHVTVKPAVVSNVPSTKPAVFHITMFNQSEAHRNAWFTFRMVNPDEALASRIYLDGAPLGSGRDFLLGEDNAVEKKLEIFCGDEDFELKDLKFVLVSKNQGNGLSYNGAITDSISLSAFFIPSSTEVNIKSPGNNWVLSEEAEFDSVLGHHFLLVKVDGFNANSKPLHRIEVQYKPLNARSWMKLRTFFKNESDVKDPTTEETIEGRTTLMAKFVGDLDQKYELRAQSFSRMGDSITGYKWVTYASEPLVGIKDMKRPRLFGKPKPADGILNVGDDVVFVFDEELAGGRLTPANFSVTAVKNGAINDHQVCVRLNGESDHLATNIEKNWSGKNLTIEFWMQMENPQDEAVLFSHGQNLELRKSKGSNKEDGIHTTGCLSVYFEGMEQPLESDSLLWEEGAWSHVAVVLDQSNGEMTLFYNGKPVGTAYVPAYDGIGKLMIGNGFAGCLDEVRIWEKVVDAVDLKYYSNRKYSGAEQGLMAYYPMEEAMGNVIHDKARGNHATLEGSWNSSPGYALTLNAKNALDINLGKAGIREVDDFTLDFWFKSNGASSADMTLFSSGRPASSDSLKATGLFIGFENSQLKVLSGGHEMKVDHDYLDNLWHHLILVTDRTGGYSQLYVDEQMVGYIDSESIDGLLTASVYLGACGFSVDGKKVFDKYFDGWIDEFRLWRTAFSGTSIHHMGNLMITGKEVGLAAYYPFEKWQRNPNNNIQEMKFTLEDKIGHDEATMVGESAPLSKEHAPLVNKGVEESVAFDFLTQQEKLLVKFLDSEETIDQTIVNVAVDGVCDIHGNKMENPVTWSVLVNSSPLRWSESKKMVEMSDDEEVRFTLQLKNLTGVAHSFVLEGLPHWLDVSRSRGEIAPDGVENIECTIAAGMRVGRYDECIYAMVDSKLCVALPLDVKVRGPRPEWSVNPHDYAASVGIFGKMKMDNVFSEDEEDLIAVFRKGTCVGVGHSEYDKTVDMWFVYLTVYTDSLLSDGTDLLQEYEFRMWDASTGRIYDALPSQPLVVNHSVCGSLKELIVFVNTERRYRDLDLEKGWNWVSFGVLDETDKSVNHTLRYGKWTDEDVIKGPAFFDSYSSVHNRWEGSMGDLGNTMMYMVKVKNAQQLSVRGQENRETPMKVYANRWNWMGYTPVVNSLVEEALADFDAHEGDVLKSQNQFSTYSHGKWVGSLKAMEANRGYMLYTTQSGEFNYPDLIKNVRGASMCSRQGVGSTALQLHRSTSLTMVVLPDYGELEPDDVIAALVDGELCGLSEPVVTENGVLHFLSVGGDSCGVVTFELRRGGKSIARAVQSMPYYPHAMRGTLDEPVRLSFSEDNSQMEVYPNPFVTHLNVEYFAEQEGLADIAVYDMAGHLVAQDQMKVHAGRNKYVWHTSSAQAQLCSGGVYLVRVVVDGKTFVREAIKR